MLDRWAFATSPPPPLPKTYFPKEITFFLSEIVVFYYLNVEISLPQPTRIPVSAHQIKIGEPHRGSRFALILFPPEVLPPWRYFVLSYYETFQYAQVFIRLKDRSDNFWLYVSWYRSFLPVMVCGCGPLSITN